MNARTFTTLYLTGMILFLYVPVLIMAVMSFNDAALFQLPVDWSVKWYAQLYNNQKLLDAATNSVVIAAITTVIATILGTSTSLAFFRYEFRGKQVLQLLLLPPLAIPWLISGTAMLIFFFWSGIGRGLHAMILGHVALAVPYVIVVVTARLRSFDRQVEEAARSLGATSWQTTFRVTLPWLAPGIAAGLFLLLRCLLISLLSRISWLNRVCLPCLSRFTLLFARVLRLKSMPHPR